MNSPTDLLKAVTGEPDLQAINHFLSAQLEPAAGSMGAPVWGGPDSAPSPTAQAFDIATGAVTADSIAARVITGDKMVAHTLTADEIDAGYVAANVANIGGTVQIDSTGERITGGKLTVTNGSSVVIIDGTSDVFKIVATGTLTTPAFTQTPGALSQATSGGIATGLTYRPSFQGYIYRYGTHMTPWEWVELSNGTVTNQFDMWVEVVSTNQTQVTAQTGTMTNGGTWPATDFRYFIMKEASI